MFVKFAPLTVRDQDRAIAFYTSNLGMTVEKDQSYGDDWRWIELGVPGGRTRIVFEKCGDQDRGSSPSLSLVVNDVDQLHEQLCAAGAKVKEPPKVASWDPKEKSLLFYDSEENLVLACSITD